MVLNRRVEVDMPLSPGGGWRGWPISMVTRWYPFLSMMDTEVWLSDHNVLERVLEVFGGGINV
jgi:hypothetical protein